MNEIENIISYTPEERQNIISKSPESAALFDTIDTLTIQLKTLAAKQNQTPEMVAIATTLQSLTSAVMQFVEKADEISHDINNLETKVKESDNKISKLEKRCEKLEQKCKEAKQESNEAKRECNDIKAEFKEYKTTVNELKEKQNTTDKLVAELYNGYTIEDMLKSLSSLGVITMDADDCKAYYFDKAEDKMFTVGINGERQYISFDNETSYLYKAFNDKLPIINNNFFNEDIGDKQPIYGVKNVAVVPLVKKGNEETNEEVIGVIVAKNKDGGFNEKDHEIFQENGAVGCSIYSSLVNKQLTEKAEIDNLTKLYNKNGLENYLQTKVLKNAKENIPYATIMVDIDHFKKFNDTYSHDFGDKVLRAVADTLKDNTRDKDRVFRYGGEEIVVLAEGMTDVDGFALAERLRQAISEIPLQPNENEYAKITASFGVATLNPSEYVCTTAANVLKQFSETTCHIADEYLYHAKHNGRNQVAAAPEVMEQYNLANHTQSIVEVVTYNCKQDVRFLAHNDCLLLDTGTPIADMKLTATDKDGKPLDIYFNLSVQGNTNVLYNDEYYTAASDFPAALKTSIECHSYSEIDVINAPYYACSHSVVKDGVCIESGEVLWNEKMLDGTSANELRTQLITHAEGIIEAVEQGKIVNRRNATSLSAESEKPAQENQHTQPDKSAAKTHNSPEITER